jgi:hypothetical protein
MEIRPLFQPRAIVVAWPVIIHAYVGRTCTLEDAVAAEWLSQVGEGGQGCGCAGFSPYIKDLSRKRHDVAL